MDFIPPPERSSAAPLTGGWVVPRIVMDVVAKIKITDTVRN